MIKLLRCCSRCAGLSLVAIFLPLDWLVLVAWRAGAAKQRSRAALLSRWARYVSRLAKMEITVHGRVPAHGLCVSNHLSYLDIVAYGAIAPMTFVSKHDVIYWPLFGQWAAMCGTLFVKRERKGHVADVGEQMAAVLRANVPLVLFPEGTSSGGETVLPFKSSLFQPAVDHAWPVTPMRIAYSIAGGSVANEIAYWGDMTLLPHLLNVFTKQVIQVVVTFGEPLAPGSSRKELCRRAHDAVSQLGQVN
ncbi:1-acyl-sn-glycerol-3-phosphate acyltransferase [bacterium]|nr:1-acyl-sn-glycerol-3-phosphate acyltransferase [bacterium]